MTAVTSVDSRHFRFGVFEVDLRAGELRRSGVRVGVQEQPLRVLEMLLEKPGELVTRDEIKQALWPGDQFGDFDHAINVAVKKLRDALDDHADKPLYIETMARRGYRFIAPLHHSAEREMDVAVGVAARATEPRLARRRRSRFFWAGAAGFVVVTAFTGVLWFHPASVGTYQAQGFTVMQGVARKPAFSPDGNEIAFSWSDLQTPRSRIYVQALGTTISRKLIDDSEPTHEELLPKWWPDGSVIAYLRYLPNQRDEIWTVPRTGGAPRKLLSLKQVLGFDISPDGRSIAVGESTGGEANFSVVIVSLVDQSRRELLPPSTPVPSGMGAYRTGDVGPVFSPDGQSIIFAKWSSSGADLYQVPVKGGIPERLTDRSLTMIDGYAWMPDGQSLIVSAMQPAASNLALFRVSLKGRRWAPIPVTSSRTSDPAISRERRLAFTQNTQSPDDIYRYELDQGGNVEPRNLTSSTCCDIYPAWSPDGRKMAFQSSRTGHYEIFVSNTDGSNPVQLTSFAGNLAGSPNWSPDGQTIVFDYRPDEHSHLFLIDASGGVPHQITFAPTNDMRPRFSKDGQWIYFARSRPGGTDIWKLPLAGGEPLLVVPDGVSGEIVGDRWYYAKIFKSGLYSRPITGGAEELLIPESNGVDFDVVKDGIYFARIPSGDETHFEVNRVASVNGRDQHFRRCGSRDIVFYDFASRRSTRVLQTIVPICFGIAIAPDRKSLLVVGLSSVDSRIMLVPDFK